MKNKDMKNEETDCATCNVVWLKPFLNHQYDMKHCLWCLMHRDNEEAEYYTKIYITLNDRWLNTPEGKEYTMELKKKGEGII